MLKGGWFNTCIPVISVTLSGEFSQIGLAQTGSSDNSWSTTSERADPNRTTNPTRTRTTHTETNGRVIEQTIVEVRSPDGRYVPYSEIERESVRMNDTTVRNIERSYGRNSDGRKTLTQ